MANDLDLRFEAITTAVSSLNDKFTHIDETMTNISKAHQEFSNTILSDIQALQTTVVDAVTETVKSNMPLSILAEQVANMSENFDLQSKNFDKFFANCYNEGQENGSVQEGDKSDGETAVKYLVDDQNIYAGTSAQTPFLHRRPSAPSNEAQPGGNVHVDVRQGGADGFVPVSGNPVRSVSGNVIVNPQRTSAFYKYPPLVSPYSPLTDGLTLDNSGGVTLKSHIIMPKAFSKVESSRGPGQFYTWLERFETYVTLQEIPLRQLHALLHSFLEGDARRYSGQCDLNIRSDYYMLCDQLLSYFDSSQNEFQLQQELESIKQNLDEPFKEFVTRLRSSALALHGHADPQAVKKAIRYGILCGSLEPIRKFIQFSEKTILVTRVATEEELMNYAEAKEGQIRDAKAKEKAKQSQQSQSASKSPSRSKGGSAPFHQNPRIYRQNQPATPNYYASQMNQSPYNQPQQFYQQSPVPQFAPQQQPVYQQNYTPQYGQAQAPYQQSPAPQYNQSQDYRKQQSNPQGGSKPRYHCDTCGSDTHSTDRHRGTKADANDKVKSIYEPRKCKPTPQVKAVAVAEMKKEDDKVGVIALDLSLTSVNNITPADDKAWEISIESARFKTAGPDLDLNLLRQTHPSDGMVSMIIQSTPHTVVQLEDRDTIALLDTGAAANILPEWLFLELLKTRSDDWAHRHIRNIRICLHGYGTGIPLNITELVTMKVQIGEVVKCIPFLVDRDSKRNALLLGWPALVSLLGNIFPSDITLSDGSSDITAPVAPPKAQSSSTVNLPSASSNACPKPVDSAEITGIGHLYVNSRRQIPPGTAALVTCRAQASGECLNQPLVSFKNLYLNPLLPSCQLSEGFISLTGSSLCKIVVDNPSSNMIDLHGGDLIGHLCLAEPATVSDFLVSVPNLVPEEARIDSHVIDIKCTDVPVPVPPNVSLLCPPSPQLLQWNFAVAELTSELEAPAVFADCQSSLGPMGLHDWKATMRTSKTDLPFIEPAVTSFVNNESLSVNANCPTDESSRKDILTELLNKNVPDSIPPEKRTELISWLVSHNDVFSLSEDNIGQCDVFPHVIETGDARPIKIPTRRTIPAYKDEVARQITMWLNIGIVRPSKSPWAAPLTFAMKKNGKLRICCDYRELNKVTKKVAWSLNRCEDLLDSLGHSKAKVFTSLDLRSGYMQLLVDEASQEKTAFSCHLGLFEYMRLPFGLCAAPATFQRTMATVLYGLPVDNVCFYLDDILVSTDTIERNVQLQEDIFDRLRKYGLKLNPDKCEFFRSDLEFLGYKVSDKGLETMPYKVAAVQTFPAPKNLKQLRRFLGMSGFYRRFIPNFSTIAQPLFSLMKKDVRFVWSDNCVAAFTKLKQLMSSAPVLVFPDYDKPFVLETDGMVERHNRTMQDQLAKCMELHGNKWEEELPFILLAYRQLPHSSTGDSPYFLQRGYDPNPISASVFSAATPPALAEGGDYVCRMESGLKSAWEEAAHRIARAQELQKTQYDKTASPVSFNVGDRVWRYLPSVAKGPGYKLKSPYLGPYIVDLIRGSVITVVAPPSFSHLKIPKLRLNAALLSAARPFTGLDKLRDGRKLHTLPNSLITSSEIDASTTQHATQQQTHQQTSVVQESQSKLHTRKQKKQHKQKADSAVTKSASISVEADFGLVPTSKFSARKNTGRYCSVCQSRHVGGCPVERDEVGDSIKPLTISTISVFSDIRCPWDSVYVNSIQESVLVSEQSKFIMANSLPFADRLANFVRGIAAESPHYQSLLATFTMEERRSMFMSRDVVNSLPNGAQLPLFLASQPGLNRALTITGRTWVVPRTMVKVIFPDDRMPDYNLVEGALNDINVQMKDLDSYTPDAMVVLWPLRIYYSLLMPPVNPPAFILVDSRAARDNADDILLDMGNLVSPNVVIFGMDFEFVGCGPKDINGKQTLESMLPPITVWNERSRLYPMRTHMWNRGGGQTIALMQLYPPGGLPVVYSLGDCLDVEMKKDSRRTEDVPVFCFWPRMKLLFGASWARFVMIGSSSDVKAVRNTTGDELVGPRENSLIPEEHFTDINENAAEWSSDRYPGGKISLTKRMRQVFHTDSSTEPESPRYDSPRFRCQFAAEWNTNNPSHIKLLKYSAVDPTVTSHVTYALALARMQEGRYMTEIQTLMVRQACLTPRDFKTHNVAFDALSRMYMHDFDRCEYQNFLSTYLKDLPHGKENEEHGQHVRIVPQILIDEYLRYFMIGRGFDPVRALWIVRNFAVHLMSQGYFPKPVGFLYAAQPSDVPQSSTELMLYPEIGCSRLNEISLVYDIPPVSASKVVVKKSKQPPVLERSTLVNVSSEDEASFGGYSEDSLEVVDSAHEEIDEEISLPKKPEPVIAPDKQNLKMTINSHPYSDIELDYEEWMTEEPEFVDDDVVEKALKRSAISPKNFRDPDGTVESSASGVPVEQALINAPPKNIMKFVYENYLQLPKAKQAIMETACLMGYATASLDWSRLATVPHTERMHKILSQADNMLGIWHENCRGKSHGNFQSKNPGTAVALDIANTVETFGSDIPGPSCSFTSAHDFGQNSDAKAGIRKKKKNSKPQKRPWKETDEAWARVEAIHAQNRRAHGQKMSQTAEVTQPVMSATQKRKRYMES